MNSTERIRIGLAGALALGVACFASRLEAATGPCDIYAAGGTPCVAAHSTTRSLFGTYSGNLYQVRRKSDNTTKDIGVLEAGGEANGSTQDAFCANTSCVISIVYDQTANHNDLTKAPGGGFPTPCLEADATAAKIKLNGRNVYGIYTTGAFEPKTGVGYRNNKTKGMPVGDEAEAMYMIVSGKHYNQWCCFDYGNAETNTRDNGPGTMEAVYFGSSTQWGRGSGTGPWVMADLEDGVFAGVSFAAPAANQSISADYVMAMLKGNTKNNWALKSGNAQSGSLTTLYDGVRPARIAAGPYDPMRKEGAIVLGVGGDNSHTGEGTFFEGCIVAGFPTNAVDEAVQANVVAAGYGKTTTALADAPVRSWTNASLLRDPADGRYRIRFDLAQPANLTISVISLDGRTRARLADGPFSSGPQEVAWNANALQPGVYLLRMTTSGRETWSERLVIER